jgi:hypothetical protein
MTTVDLSRVGLFDAAGVPMLLAAAQAAAVRAIPGAGGVLTDGAAG